MPVYYVQDPNTLEPVAFPIAGDQPTPQEADLIRSYFSSQSPQESDGNFFTGAGRGVAGTLAQIPTGVAGLIEQGLLGKDVGETFLGRLGQRATESGLEGVYDVFGRPSEEDGTGEKFGEALGSIGAFFIPPLGAARLASLAGAGVRGAKTASRLAAGSTGVALGSAEQRQRIAQLIAEGKEVDNQQAAVLMGGAVGATELLPISRLLGDVVNIIKKVPAGKRDEALKLIRGRVVRAAQTGVAEGSQEVLAGVAQDLIEKNLYNPEAEVAPDADEFIYGGGAGAALDFFVNSIRGRAINRAERSRKQSELEEDLAEQDEEARQKMGFAQGLAGEGEQLDLDITTPEAKAPTEAEQEAKFKARESEIKGEGLPLFDDQAREDIPVPPRPEARPTEPVEEQIDLPLGGGTPGVGLPLFDRKARIGAQARIDNLDTKLDVLESQARSIEAGKQTAESRKKLKEIINQSKIVMRQRQKAAEIRRSEIETKDRDLALEYDTAIDNVLSTGSTSLGTILDAVKRVRPTAKMSEAKKIRQEMVDLGDIDFADGEYSIPTYQAPEVGQAKAATKAATKATTTAATKATKAATKLATVDDVINEAELQMGVSLDESRKEELRERAESRRKRSEMGTGEVGAQAERTASKVASVDPKVRERYRAALPKVLESLKERLKDLNIPDVDLMFERLAFPEIDGLVEGYTESSSDYIERQLKESETKADNELNRLIQEIDTDQTLNARQKKEQISDLRRSAETQKEFLRKQIRDKRAGLAGKRVIALSTDIYDPTMTEQELTAEIGAVMNHEIIHALRDLGLFSQKEFQILERAASTRNYTKMVDGKPVERAYTYLDRARKMYPDSADSIQREEAVAELFRDWASGKIKIGGKPKSLFRRIVNFIKSMFGANADQGFTNASQIFEAIESGKIGQRERSEVAETADGAGPKFARRNLFPVPERLFDKVGLDDNLRRRGGTYVTMDNREDFTGKTFGNASISIDEDGRPALIVEDTTETEPNTKASGNVIRTNLFKSAAGWKWLEGGNENIRTLVSVETSKGHTYTLSTSFRTPVTLKTYPDSPSEPRLRPTTYGKTSVGNRVGTISVRGKEHPVYDRVVVYSETDGSPSSDIVKLISSKDGFSVDPRTGNTPTSGFAVAPVKSAEIVVDRSNLNFGDLDSLVDSIISMSDMLGKEVYVGGWFNPEDGMYYIDGSLVLDSKEDALYLGDAADQIAIYDIGENNVINTQEGIQQLREAGTYSDQSRNEQGRSALALDRAYREARDKSQNAKLSRIGFQQGGIRGGINVGGATTPLEGSPIVRGGIQGPIQEIVNVADRYARSIGLPVDRQAVYVDIDEDFSTRVAQAFEDMKHNPSDPTVSRAYRDLIEQTRNQYQALTDAGYEFYLFDGDNDPYDTKPFNAMRDLRFNKRMGVFSTKEGFGTDESFDPSNNPLLERTGIYMPVNSPDGPVTEVLANDLFRAVHDAFGHGIEGAGFRARGEENAWQAHARLFTGDALKAMTTETRGQNSWLNFGPYGETNRTAGLFDTVFADQKIGLLPDFAWSERVAPTTPKLSKIGGRGVLAPKAETNPFNVDLKRTSLPYYPEQYDNNGVVSYRLTGEERFPPNSQSLFDAADWLYKKTSESIGSGDKVPYTDESKEYLARLMATESLKAKEYDDNAIGWYDDQIESAKRVISIVEPDIISTPENEVIFDWALAVTSNGQAVFDNFVYALEAFRFYKSNGRLPVSEWKKGGKRNSSMRKNFKFVNDYNKLLESGDIKEPLGDFLSREFTVKEIKIAINDMKKEFGIDISVPGGELVGTRVYGSFLAGPKIGQGFYQNIRGNFEPLTMDIWWMRMWNRLVNRPFKEKVPDEVISQKRRELRRDISQSSDPVVKQVVLKAMESLGVTPADLRKNRDFDDFIPAINRSWELYFKQYQKKFDKNPEKPQVFRDAKSLEESIYGSLQATPVNGTERAFMRDVVSRAKDLLFDKGVDINTADLQALLWYPEKRLFEALGVRKGKGQDSDYKDAAILTAKREGVSDDAIEKALSDSGRDRVASGPDSRRSISGFDKEALQEGDSLQPDQESARVSEDSQRKKLAVLGRRAFALPKNSSKLVQDVENHRGQLLYTASSNAISNVLGYVPGIDKGRVKKRVDDFLTKFQDRMLPVARLVDDLQKSGMTIAEAFDPYLKYELFQGRTGALIEQASKSMYEPLLEEINKLKLTDEQKSRLMSITGLEGEGFFKSSSDSYNSDSLALAESFLYALHAKERNRRIESINPGSTTGSGMLDSEADKILDVINSLSKDQRTQLNRVRSMAKDIIADTKSKRVEYGLTPDFDAEVQTEDGRKVNVVNDYRDYVPLKGHMFKDDETVETRGEYGMRGFGARGREDRRALGRTSYGRDIVANIMQQNQQAYVRGEKNEIGKTFLRMIESAKKNPALEPNIGGIEILERRPMRLTIGSNGLVRTTFDTRWQDKEQYFVVKDKGKEIVMKIDDPRIARAMNGAGGESARHLDSIMKPLRKINRYLSSINTSLNPEFLLTNFTRDLQTAFVNINQYDIEGIKSDTVGNVFPAMRGMWKVINNKDSQIDDEFSQVYKDFLKAGGQNMANSTLTLEDQLDKINDTLKILEDKPNINKMRAFGKKFGDFIENYNTIVENAVRISAFDTLRKKGGFTDSEAAQAARNLTVNFAKGGEYRDAMNALYLFYNASLQGSFALFQAATKSKSVRKMWLGMAGMGLVFDQINGMLSEEDEDGKSIYDKIPDYVLEHNIIIMNPFTDAGERNYIKIPLPYGLNTAYNLGRSVSRVSRGEYTAAEAASSSVMTLVDAFNPLGGTNSFYNFAAPTVLDPFVDLVRNEDFSGKPIYKDNVIFGVESPASQLYWNSTSPSMRFVADTLSKLGGGTDKVPGEIDLMFFKVGTEVNPDILEYWLDFLTGGVGRFVERSVSGGLAGFGFSDLEEGITPRQIPFVRTYLRSVTERENIGDYIEGRDRVLLARSELKSATEAGDRERVLNARERFSDELKIAGMISRIENARKKLVRQRNDIMMNDRIADANRERILKVIDTKIQALVGRAQKIMRERLD